MQKGYFKTALHDIAASPGWFTKLLILSLISLIPIFGQIVVFGYLYGWAREIAWNLHTPLPAHIFSNPEGTLYKRGAFALVIGIIALLIPTVVLFAETLLAQGGTLSSNALGSVFGFHPTTSPFAAFSGFTQIFVYITFWALLLFSTVLQWVGCMRMSIYGRLSAGLQLNQLWAMARRDFGGLLRILGISILFLCAASIASGIIGAFTGIILSGAQMAASSATYGGTISMVHAFGICALMLAVFVCVSGGTIVPLCISMFSTMLTTRACGYWTRQFDVEHWRGQDDPLPPGASTPKPSTNGGDACESNTPETFCAPHNGFEDRENHRALSISTGINRREEV